MIEKQVLKIPVDYKMPLEKDIIFILDQFPNLIREKEFIIIELNNKGNEQSEKIKERSQLIINLMIKEGRYKPNSAQFEQVHKSRMLRDIEGREAAQEKIKIQHDIRREKVELNFLMNRFKGAQAIAHRKLAMEK